MKSVFICDAVRTPVGRYGGALSAIRTDDLAAIPIKALAERNRSLDPAAIGDVILGCANQAGEDNRNVARMALLLSGLPETVPGMTVNRLCGSGMEAVAQAFRMIASGDADVVIAGGVESMSRAPFVIPKAAEPFSRDHAMYDTTIGWRFINPRMEHLYGVDSMIRTAENLAAEYNISREEQDMYAHTSQMKTAEAQKKNGFADEIVPVEIIQKKGDSVWFADDEHPRLSTLEKLASLQAVMNPGGTVTAGNSSGINDGASALLIASESAVVKYNLNPLCQISGCATSGVSPRKMGIGPVYSTDKLLQRLNLRLQDFDLIEINEAFAAQVLACLKHMHITATDERINPLGGAIALGHPLGMSGARLVTTAACQLKRNTYSRAVCTMCIGVGQGISLAIEKVK
jgi:3-oxoadipyl-CoA thiolase